MIMKNKLLKGKEKKINIQFLCFSMLYFFVFFVILSL